MKYKELIVHFHEIDEARKQSLINTSMEQFGCLGVEEINLDFEEVDQEKWHLQSANEDLSIHSESSNDLKFFYEMEKEDCERLKSYIEENFSELLKKIWINVESSSKWEDEWKKYLQPIQIGKDLCVNFVFEPDHLKNENPAELIIYPGMGFGTGGHETTSLCLEIMNEVIKNDEVNSCIDYGCGSGILGILAAKRSVGSVDFFDIDEDALVNCRQNMNLNNVDQTYLVTARKAELKEPADLVMANILLHILQSEEKKLKELSKKHLVLSGVLKTQEDEIIEFFTKDGQFNVVDKRYKKEWIAIHLQRN